MLQYKIMNISELNDLPNSFSPNSNTKVAVIESDILVTTAKSLIEFGMPGIIYTIEHKDILSIKFRTTLGKTIFLSIMQETNDIANETKVLDAAIGYDHLEEVGLLLMSARREGFEFITILPEE